MVSGSSPLGNALGDFMFNKNAFVTVSTASVISSILATSAIYNGNTNIAIALLAACAVITSIVCWEFACATKSCAEKRLAEVNEERDTEALWRELDKLHERISAAEQKVTVKR